MSLSRARLKELRGLLTAKERRRLGVFLIEGEKLVREALAADGGVREVLAVEDQVEALELVVGGTPLTPISRSDAERLADTRTPQGCFAVLADRVLDAADALLGLDAVSPATVVILDGVQDPGNVGAVIRSAAAFGADLVVCGPGSADPTHPKVVRAATGAWFHTSVARCEALEPLIATVKSDGWAVLMAAVGGSPVGALEPVPARRVVVLGSEGSGLSASVAASADGQVGVVMAAGVESLNVAVAAGILLSELRDRDPSGAAR